MWNEPYELTQIKEELWKDPINSNHSGFSLAYILREMEYIAKNSYNDYKNNYKK